MHYPKNGSNQKQGMKWWWPSYENGTYCISIIKVLHHIWMIVIMIDESTEWTNVVHIRMLLQALFLLSCISIEHYIAVTYCTLKKYLMA